MIDKPGLLLVNLGTPKSPAASDVRPYLREFLSDPRVIDIAGWKRWLLLNLFILPFRPRASGEAYEKIWTEQGSPLMLHSVALRDATRQRLGPDVVVELAMRYGEPSIASGLRRLFEQRVSRVVVFPLYPQYSAASTGSTIEKVCEEVSRLWNVPYLQFVPPFYDHSAYIDACAALAAPVIEQQRPERVLFSFHGVPERQIGRGDPSGSTCLREGCCDAITPDNANCYRAQCYATARALAGQLGVSTDRRVICFQSRLGRSPWITPYTDVVIRELAAAGVKRAVILSPAFVADCLETLEELGIRAAEDFRAHGGEELSLVPCVNVTEAWCDAVVRIARESSGWLGPQLSPGEVAPATARR